MPVVERKDRLAIADLHDVREKTDAVDDTPGFWDETIPAAFRLENSIGSYLSNNLRLKRGTQNPDFDPFVGLEGTHYADFAESFVSADSEEDVVAVKRQIDRELEDRETIAASGLKGFAAYFATGAIDPLWLLPFGGATAATVKGLRATSALGNILRGGAVTARAGFLGMTAFEASAQATQEVRTAGESIANVAAGTILSGVLGGSIVGLSVRKRNTLIKQIDEHLRIAGGADINEIPISSKAVLADTKGTGVGAVEAEYLKVKGALGLEKLLAAIAINPIIRMAVRSPSLGVKRLVQRLVDTPFLYKGNALGKITPVSVESKTTAWTARLISTSEGTTRLFDAYRMRIAGKRGDVGSDVAAGARRRAYQAKDLIRPDIDALSWREFRREVSKALRRGDRHVIPEIQEAAEMFRREVFDPLKNRAIELKMLPEDVEVETALSYLTRVWIPEKIKGKVDIDGKPILNTRLEIWLQDRHPDLSPIQITEAVEDIVNKLTGAPDGRIVYERLNLGDAAPLKSRTLTIEDRLIEDFLDDDILNIARHYVRTMAPDIEMKAEFGDVDLAGVFKEIDAEYRIKSREAKSARERKKLDNAQKRDKKELAALRDLVRGTYNAPKDPDALIPRFFSGMRKMQLLSQGGGFAISSIPDLARVSMTQGMVRTLRSGLVPMTTNYKKFRVVGREAKLAGVAGDMILDTRAKSMADIGDSFGRHSAFERGLDSATHNFFLINGLGPWNSAQKQFAGVVISARILDATTAVRAGRISAKRLTKLAMGGIDEDMAGRIADEFARHGEAEGGLRLPNTEAWTDRGAREAFRAALRKDIDIAIVTPGVGDRPLWMSSELGRAIGQYRTFAMTAVTRVMLLGMQERNVAQILGVFNSVALGMLVYKLKMDSAGLETSDDLHVWVAEGIDRSGVLGYFSDVNNMLQKANLGTNRLTGGPTASRYASRNIPSAIAGPTFGRFATGFGLLSSFAKPDVTQADIKNLRRLAPYQNVFWLESIWDRLENLTNESFSVPDRSRRRRRRR